jgi:hypothetical protein
MGAIGEMVVIIRVGYVWWRRLRDVR